jgi:hypothetical protein
MIAMGADMTSLHRAQLLLEAEQHRALARIAQREGRSMSDLVREIVRRHLAEADEGERKQLEPEALNQLGVIRERVREKYGVIRGDLVAEVRKEREQELESAWRGEA